MRPADAVRASLEDLLAAALGDAVIAESATQTRTSWHLRESVGATQTAAGPVIKHDISVPISRIPAFLAAAERALDRWRDTLEFITFGHIGDGNLHYNFSPRDDAARYRPAIETAMQRRTKATLDPRGVLNPGKKIA